MEVGNAARHRDWQLLGSDERLKLVFSDCFGSRWTDGGGTAVSRGCGSWC